jgi:hypothetical protein
MRIRTPALVLAAVLCAGAASAQQNADPPSSEVAKQHFKAGVDLLKDPEGERVEEAYREFKTAYDLSSNPKILGNVGYCAMRLERDGEAIDAYSTYLREVKDIAQEERDQITRDLSTLTVGVARVTLEADKPGVVYEDVRVPVRGDKVTNAYPAGQKTKVEIGIRPGHHLVTAKADGYEDATWELDAHAGARESHAFVMKAKVIATPMPVQPQPGGDTGGKSSGPGVLPWVVVGVGGAMLVTGTITGIVALGKTSDIEKACPQNTCPKSFDLESERSSARTFVRLTDVMLIAGGILVAGGITWAVLAGGSNEKKSASVACGPFGCAGSF